MSAPDTAATPRCPHFGACGGCQHQDLVYGEQLRLKRTHLEALLRQAGVATTAELTIHSATPWEYRNRIRLRLQRMEGVLRFGYNRPNSTEFLPITTCPIAAPALLRVAEALLAAVKLDRDAEFWLNAASEVELFCDHDAARVQMTLHCAPRTKAPKGSFDHMLAAVQSLAPMVVGAAAIAADPRTGPTGRTLASSGANGLGYRVLDQTYWITRGGFFQVNRFLIETLVHLVCDGRNGGVVWDLYSGVGLFSLMLARTFGKVTAVEANPTAVADVRAALHRLGPRHAAVESTTLDFLQSSVVQRERPELVVLDPPRAGTGAEACELLLRLEPRSIVYVSCDPVTLTRDLGVLQKHYQLTACHLVDLFPQTSHIETVAILHRITYPTS